MLTRFRSVLSKPAAPVLLGGLALLMGLPSLGFGLLTDDHMHARGFASGHGALEMLQIAPAQLDELRQVGVFSWWSSPDLAVRFLRPLASLTHWVEFALWPDAAWAMHLSNVIVYALLVAVAAFAYRALLGPGALAGLAALLFAIDDGHANSVGWISSRNTLLATLFALLALLLHVRARQSGRRALLLASAACTALALLSAEFGVAAFAYLAAYALVLDSGPAAVRLRTLAPHLLVAAIWAAVYIGGGYGLRHAGWYRDPGSEPLAVIGQGLLDLPLWLFCQVAINIGEFVVVVDPTVPRLLALALLVPVLAWLAPALRRSREARFFALALVLSILPLFTTHPQGRLLLAASFAGLGWIACALQQAEGGESRFMQAGRRVLRALHLFVAPLMFAIMLGQLTGIERAAQRLAGALPPQGGREAVIVNLPLELLSQGAWDIRAKSGAPPLASFHQLYAGRGEVSLERIDERTLDVSVAGGWGRIPFERLFSARAEMPALGSTRNVRNLRATVLAVTDGGLPARVRFEFPDRLESEHRTWLVWRGKRPVRFAPPRRGERLSLPTVSALDLDNLPE